MVRSGTSYMFVTDNVGSVTAHRGRLRLHRRHLRLHPYGTLAQRRPAEAWPPRTSSATPAPSPTLTASSTGYVHDGARWYNPATGAFTTQDTNSYLANPANGNRYAYAADNPANYTDPTGHSILGCIASVVGGVAAVGSLVGISLATAGTADVFAAGALIAGAGTAAEQIGFFSAVTAVLGSGAGAADAC